MSNDPTYELAIQRAIERIRQERETFGQRKKHENQWFVLRLIMGFSSIVLLASVMVICSIILLNPSAYSAGVVTAAGVALFTDVLGLLIGVWKIVINPGSITALQPVTAVEPFLAGVGTSSLDSTSSAEISRSPVPASLEPRVESDS